MSKKQGVIVSIFVLAILLIGVISTFAIVTVDGDSMSPTLEDREMILVNTKAFASKDADIGDIVVAVHDEAKIVKRVVGVPGDRITYKNNVFHRNGEADAKIVLPDSYLKSEDVKNEDDGLYLEDNEYYLLGDNIEVSADSRDMGAFNASELLGKVLFK